MTANGVMSANTPAGAAPATPAAPVPNIAMGMGRAMRAMMAFQQIKADYDTAYKGLDDLSYDELIAHPKMKEVHARGAQKALEVCRANRGIYIKAAQFVASLQGGAGDHGIPRDYVTVLQVLMDHAPHHTFEEIESVFVEDFGKPASELFKEIDKTPIAAASLAQVHRAVLHSGEEVAVKVEYPGLWEMMSSDFGVFHTMAGQMRPGGFDLKWLVEDLQVALTAELDFTHEGKNAERCKQMFAHRKDVKVPAVHWPLCSKRVLTMEYVESARVNDIEELTRMNLRSKDVACKLSSVFAEMTLCHGFVHGDPHAGNVHVRPLPGSPSEPQIVIMDHGLYHTIDDSLRRDFCELVTACILGRRGRIRELGKQFAGPLHRYFPLILSPWFIFGSKIGMAEIKAAKNGSLPPDVKLKDIGDFLVGIHEVEKDNGDNNMLGVLHSMGYTRGLLNDLKLPERNRVKAFGEFATKGTAPDGQRPGSCMSPARITLATNWRKYLELCYVSTSIDVLAVQLNLLVTLSKPKNQAAILAAMGALAAVGYWKLRCSK
eukprot:CAMPEP_0118923986 /NCGR_PEP_ID=MMETSP1169-20130426/2312_1 /TAXON_ID=36882 /ORGANISM="Pyramimonas obovata, Strain CCMP722" /LENGTH=545 /DNA_ID=CAMNT_0006865059 /DNA_START=44 /DNA_END=1681 /DNA_ORIENTATION=-